MTHRQAKTVLSTACGVAIVWVVGVLNGVAGEPESQEHVGPEADRAMVQLKQGNRRCIEGESSHAHDLAKWRERLLVEQKPFATVLSCSDSRVPPELLFDQGFGDLFVVRIAGNIVDPDVIGSIQYAVEHLDNKLVVVMGHQNCGAVMAALAPPDETKSEPPELQGLLDRIRPAVGSVDRAQSREALIAAAVEANVLAMV